MNSHDDKAVSDREVVLTRRFDAPARIVFLALSSCEHIRKWFGPAGYPITLCEMDFRVGGRLRLAMTGPDGQQMTPFGGAYLEIVPDRKIVFENAFEEPGAPKMVMTYLFEEAEGRTTLEMRTLFESAEVMQAYLGMGMVEGTNSAFDQLVQVVASLRAGAA